MLSPDRNFNAYFNGALAMALMAALTADLLIT